MISKFHVVKERFFFLTTSKLLQKGEGSSHSLMIPPKIEKHYLKDYNAIPGLAYVNITLSSPDQTFAQAKTHVRALHDSGCAKSIIHQKVFDELCKRGQIDIIPPERPTVIISYSGEVQPVTGTANIILHFEGINNVQKSFQLNVLVHSGTTQDFLLGRDFTGSDARAFETNHFLFLSPEHLLGPSPVFER